MKNDERSFGLTHTWRRLWRERFRQSFADIRWNRLRYMLIFAHAPLFANIQERFFEPDPLLWAVDAITLMRLAYCMGAGLLFIFADLKNIPRFSRVLAAAGTLLFFLWMVLGGGVAAVLCACGFTFCYGGCAAMVIFHYTYALNSSERFLGAALTSLYYVIFQLILATNFMFVEFSRIYMGGLVLVTCVCVFSYRRRDYWRSVVCPRSAGRAQIGLMLFFFLAYHIIEMFYTYIQGVSDSTTLLVNALVGLLVFGLALFLYFRVKFNVWHMCNLFFVAFFIAYLLRLVTQTSAGLYLSRSFRGFEQLGFIASYTLLGSILQMYADFRVFKRILIATLNGFTLLYALLGIVLPRLSADLPLVAVVVSLGFFILFLFMAPAYARYVFDRRNVVEDNGELVESDRQNVESALAALLLEYKLTPRECEIVRLLWAGQLYKQCAGELGISAETVKFHAHNSYRKLGISSRNELFALLQAKLKS